MQQQIEKLKAKLAVLQSNPAQEAPANQESATSVQPWASIADDDPEVLSLMERLEGEEFLRLWPEYKNRTLEEAKEIAYLRRISGDATKGSTERSEAENRLMTIRRRLRGDK